MNPHDIHAIIAVNDNCFFMVREPECNGEERYALCTQEGKVLAVGSAEAVRAAAHGL